MDYEYAASFPKMSKTTTLKNTEHTDLCVILLASTIANKSRMFGQRCLIKLGNKTVLERQVEVIRKAYSKSELIIVTGDDTNGILRQNITGTRIVENQLRETSMVEDLRLAVNNTPMDKILFINSDYLFNDNSICHITDQSSIVVESKGSMDKGEVGVNVCQGKVVYFSYSSEIKWTHIAYIEGQEFFVFKKLLNAHRGSRLLVHEILNKMLDDSDFRVIEPQGMDIKKIKVGENADLII